MCISNCFALKNCTTYASGHEEHRRFKEGADLKYIFFHLVGTFLRREMTNVQQSTVFATCAVSSWFCLHVQCFALVEKRQ